VVGDFHQALHHVCHTQSVFLPQLFESKCTQRRGGRLRVAHVRPTPKLVNAIARHGQTGRAKAGRQNGRKGKPHNTRNL